MSELNSIKNFLRRASIKIEAVNEAKRLYGSQIAPDFFIFDYLRDDEMGLSWCLGSLLDPHGKHGQGALFLEQFLLVIDQNLEARETVALDEQGNVLQTNYISRWSAVSFDKCRMKVEHSTTESRRIDIHLHFCNGEVIGIENKPWAGDQVNQLSDYAAYIERQAASKSWLLIYLCNSEPSVESITRERRRYLEEKGHLLNISFYDVASWLQHCIGLVKAPSVRMFVEELEKFIRKEINREVDMEIKSQLMTVIEDDLSVAMQVSNSIVAVKKNLLAKLKADLTTVAIEKGYKFIWKTSLDAKWSAYSGFGFNLSESQAGDFEVWFEFAQPDLRNFYWGIRRKNESVSSKSPAYKELNGLMAAKYLSKNPSTLWWPWWSYYDSYKSWETDPNAWVGIKDGSFVKEIMSLVEEVQQYFIESNVEKHLTGELPNLLL
jgi:hypothetical protein